MIGDDDALASDVVRLAGIGGVLDALDDKRTAAGDALPLLCDSGQTESRISRKRGHTCSINHSTFSQVCAFPCHTLESIHLPESCSSSLPYFFMKTGSDMPISLPTVPP